MLHRRIVPIQLQDRSLPLVLDSIGHNSAQEPLQRRNGYHVYHWLQTIRGEGTVSFSGRIEPLPAGQGLLLPPGMPHAYEQADSSEIWETRYITFGGPAAVDMLGTLKLTAPALYSWETGAPLDDLLDERLAWLDSQADPLGLESSQAVYSFLLSLRTYARPDTGRGSRVLSQLRQLEPLLLWLDSQLADPGLGLEELSAKAGVSGRRLNTVFRELFGVSPYSYLLRLRIRRAKELLVSQPGSALRSIADEVGFRDVSHFIATFRRLTGETPDRFRTRRR